MSIDDKHLLLLLKEVRQSSEIGGKHFPSRFEYEPFSSPGMSGLALAEKRPDLRERDRHIVYAVQQGLLSGKLMELDGRQDFNGGILAITPYGEKFFQVKSETWLKRQIRSIWDNILTILVAVLIAQLSAWALQITGLGR